MGKDSRTESNRNAIVSTDLIRMLDFEDLRLDALKGLAHLCAQAYLPDRKLLEGPDVLHGNAQYWR